MSFSATVVNVLVASPSDVSMDRDAVERAILDWNRAGRASRQAVVLLPLRWELDAVPLMGGSAQEQINSQLVASADIVIAFFHARLGQATSFAASGTAEEIVRSWNAGKPVHVYFCERDTGYHRDEDQFHKLQAYRRELTQSGLCGTYSDTNDLCRMVRDALEVDIHDLLEIRASQRSAYADEGSDDRALPLQDALAIEKARGRVEMLLARNRPVALDELFTEVDVSASSVPEYWTYSFRESWTVRVVSEPVMAVFRVRVTPSFMNRKEFRSAGMRSQAEDDAWCVDFYPQVLNPDDWSRFVDHLQMTCTLRANRRPKRQMDQKAVMTRESDGESASITSVSFACSLQLSESANILEYALHGIPHPQGPSSLHFYADNICLGQWTVISRFVGEGAQTLHTPISSSATRTVTEYDGVSRTEFHPSSALFPDDALVITVRETSRGR